MIRRRQWIPFLLAVLLSAVWASSSQAQSAEFVVINHVTATEGAENLALNVFFDLRDANGRPITGANIESASIQLLGSGSEPVPASVENPQSTVYIVLLIDGSGSMAGVIDGVREAARSAIDVAPPTARFGVFQFNETSTLIEGFTNNLDLVKAAINVVQSEPNKGTCLYDATFEAIRLLDRQIQNPEERRAVILFTDGKDQLRLDSPEPCSRHTYQDVINAAVPSDITAPITPVHTIGLFDATGTNLDVGELETLAADTQGFAVTSDQANLSDNFREIMEGLNSQLLARANVIAKQGVNQAVLSIKLRDRDAPLTKTFSFLSNTDYDVPPPPVNVQISSLQYDVGADNYLLSLSLTSPESVLRIVVGVWDVRRGVQVSADQFFDNPGETLVAELGTDSFEAEREYSIRVQAIDKEGFLITNEDEETILAEAEIVYEPPIVAPEPVEFSIQSVNADYENKLLTVDLDVAEPERVQTYTGFIVDESTGGRIHDFGPEPFESNRITETLPDVIALAEVGGLSYRVTVQLTTVEDLRSDASFDDFSPVPPEPPGMMTRIVEALSSNPAIAGSIGVIVLVIVVWMIFRGQRRKAKEVPLPRPPVDKTMIFADAEARSGASDYDDWFPEEEALLGPIGSGAAPSITVKLTIVKTPGQASASERVITDFPSTVGREGCDINIGMDRRISREHMEISVKGGEVMIADLGSSNGTFVDGAKLAPHSPTPLAGAGGPVKVRLGSQTHLELELV